MVSGPLPCQIAAEGQQWLIATLHVAQALIQFSSGIPAVFDAFAAAGVVLSPLWALVFCCVHLSRGSVICDVC